MNPEPPPTADPRTVPLEKANVTKPSARNLARSGFQLWVVGVTLYLCVAAFIPTDLPAGFFGGSYILGYGVAFGCCIIGLMRLVEACAKFVRPRIR